MIHFAKIAFVVTMALSLARTPSRAAAAPPPAAALPIVVDSPRDYQVFQRQSRTSGTVLVQGAIRGVSGQAQVRWIGKALEGELPGKWQTLPVDAVTGQVKQELTVPAGGWYRMEFRVASDNTDAAKTIAQVAVEHVGVGEVFVVAGQSNSTNYGSEKQRPASGMVASFSGNGWAIANDPQPGVQDGSKGGSFIPAFGDALYEKYKVPIGVASTGQGATSVRQWLPKGERMSKRPTIDAFVKPAGPSFPGQWESTGQLFDGLAKRLDGLGARGCRAVLWHQGESDAGQARSGYPVEQQITGEEYQRYMKTLIEASRKQAGWDVPWFVAQATYHSEQDAADKEFRDAQAGLWKSGAALEGPDTDALRAEFRDGVHFNGKGQQAHGKLWAQKVGVHLDKLLAPPPAAP